MPQKAPEIPETWRTRLCVFAEVFAQPGVNVHELATLVTAVLNLGQNRLPALGRTAWIDRKGRIRANYVTAEGKRIKNMPLMPVQQYVDTYRRLGEAVCLNEEEYAELFLEFRKWLGRDERVTGTQEDSLKTATKEAFGSKAGALVGVKYRN